MEQMQKEIDESTNLILNEVSQRQKKKRSERRHQAMETPARAVRSNLLDITEDLYVHGMSACELNELIKLIDGEDVDPAVVDKLLNDITDMKYSLGEEDQIKHLNALDRADEKNAEKEEQDVKEALEKSRLEEERIRRIAAEKDSAERAVADKVQKSIAREDNRSNAGEKGSSWRPGCNMM